MSLFLETVLFLFLFFVFGLLFDDLSVEDELSSLLAMCRKIPENLPPRTIHDVPSAPQALSQDIL